MEPKREREPQGFTLIELLIVVAILAILAAIAIPNLLEAQIRSKISRVKSDFRTVDTALNSYLTDYSQYPVNQQLSGQAGAYFLGWLCVPGSNLTSPVAYMSKLPDRDPLWTENDTWNNPHGLYQYFYYGSAQADPYPDGMAWMIATGYSNTWGFREAFALVSWGPDKSQSNGEHLEFSPPWAFSTGSSPTLYDATNGTVSNGDIVRFGGGSQSPFAHMTR